MYFLFLLLVVAAVAKGKSPHYLRRECGIEVRKKIIGNFPVELTDPEWKDDIQNEGVYGNKARTKLSIQGNPSQVQYQQCALPNGKNGRCRPVHHCFREEFRNDFIRFMDYMCVLPGNSVGACCPTDVDGVEGLAGDLPAVAPTEENNEAVLRVGRAENRGCGLSTHAQGRVTGSRPANPRDWPWMASITPYGFEQYCGGVLITDRHVLTAAHCTRRWEADELFVRLGEYDLERTNDSRTYNFKVVEIIQHQDFEIANYHHDIAILKLHRPAVFNTYVWPICLPPIGMDLTGQSSTIIGWGTQSYGGPHSNVLMEVSFPVWEHQTCIDSFTDSVFDETLCAAGHEGQKDACQGDSGGPLMYQMASGRWSVIGIVSWGVRCGEPNHPGLYTRVDKYIDWIVRNARF